MALSEGCCASTIKSGFRATGLFPFTAVCVQRNQRLFQMADTLDAEKMKENFFGTKNNLSVCEGYKVMKETTGKLHGELEEAREALQKQFPELCKTLDQVPLAP